jgi:branched-chain amino acid transport system permease protein
MPEQLFQFLVTGVTVGSLYALVGLGFALIYNASDVVNFAQGEFVMLGAMTAISLVAAGWPLVLGGHRCDATDAAGRSVTGAVCD